jgi:catalase
MDPESAVDTINARFGRHPRARALHAKGFYARGTFTASPQAKALSRAVHLQGDPIPALVRLSNGSGDPTVPDFAPDVRGMGVKLELPDGTKTDLVMQSAPKFFATSPDEFVEFVKAGGSAIGLPKFLLTHPKVIASLPANAPALRPIPSFAQCRFYGVHAYKWLAADGSSRHVRCDFRPEAGDARISPKAAKALGKDYLREELAGRLPARWVLDVQIAEPGDTIDDPSAHWPSSRQRVDAGTLELTELVEDPEAGGSVIVVFDPSRVTDGIELTGDPVLAFRPGAYSASVSRRTG